jgi:Tol biopolymer transport system component
MLSFWREGKEMSTCKEKWKGGIDIIPVNGSLNLALTLQYSGKQLVLADLDQCKDLVTYLDYLGEKSKSIYGFSFSKDNKKILYTELDNANIAMPNYRIYIYDVATQKKTELFIGGYASLSPDMKEIAFTAFDGIYVSKVDGSQKLRIVDYDAKLVGSNITDFEKIPPRPVWSPDGKWLIYHKCMMYNHNCNEADNYSIFKNEIATGKEIKIIDRGLNPYWRNLSEFKSP